MRNGPAGVALLVMMVCAAGAAGQATSPASSAAAGQVKKEELAEAALGIIEFKCAQCHGPDVARPPRGFGYVTDLRKLVETGKVMAGRPEDSPLFQMVSVGMMPTPKARNGKMLPDQVEAIRAWIMAGAPAPEFFVAAPTAASGPAGAEGGSTFKLWAGRLGKFHLQIIHFPIALLLVAALAEIVNRFRPAAGWRKCSRFCLWLGTIGAAGAVATGWLLSFGQGPWGDEGPVLEVHESLGIAAVCVAAGMVVLGWLLPRLGKAGEWIYLAGLICLAVLVGVTGHYGGIVAWGRDFFAW